jgi:hypothetical protein
MFGTLKKSLEDVFSAQAFAEAGELGDAMRMAGLDGRKALSVEDAFAAAAFAEVGCRDEALELLGRAPKRLAPTRKVSGFLESVGLAGAHVAYGLAEA